MEVVVVGIVVEVVVVGIVVGEFAEEDLLPHRFDSSDSRTHFAGHEPSERRVKFLGSSDVRVPSLSRDGLTP